ncbi:MAG: conjugal transfer protein TraN [Sulfuritalea sp.]|nr:conjugal transfer protein TraN [Sulfuritalea sp.]
MRWLFPLLFLCASIADAQDYSTDRAASKAFIENFSKTTGPEIQQRDYSNVDTSQAAVLGSHTASLGTHRAANLDRINQCRAEANTDYKGVSNQEKLDCNAVITAANVTFAPNPYLDTANPKGAEFEQTAKSLRTVQRTALDKAASGEIANPMTFSSKTDCGTQSNTTPAASRLDYCRAERPVTPTTCPITVSNQLVDGKIVSHDDPSLCSAYAMNPSCVPGGITCTLETDVDTGAKDDTGKPVLTRVCGIKTQGYDCWGVNAAWNLANCSALANNPQCAPTGKESPVQLVSGNVVWKDLEYSCVMKPEQVSITSACKSTTCVGGTCFDTTPAANQDFASMAVGMEMVREAGVYSAGGESNLRVFHGDPSSCTRPTGIGIGANCCNASGAALVNNRDILPAIAWQAAGSAVVSAGRYGAQQATSYAYDMMMSSQSDFWQSKAWEALGSGAYKPGVSPEFGMSLGAYGFNMSLGSQSGSFVGSLLPSGITESLASNSLVQAYNAATTTLFETTIGGMNLSFTFNPYMMAAMIAIQVIQEMNSCSVDEKLLSARRGGNLCVKLGEHCSMQLPWPLKTCIQITEDWCCWNSRLAQVIAVQGGAQLGGGPRCGGFSPDELTKIDFSKIDFSAFAAEMRASIVLPDSTYSASTASQTSIQATRARDAVNPSQSAAGAVESSLTGYAEGRVGSMLKK